MTRDGRSIRSRTFEATDGSTDKVVSLTLWENEWINKAASWEPKRTVLLLVNALVAYDNFKKKIVLSIGFNLFMEKVSTWRRLYVCMFTVRKTMITENPDIPQCAAIRNTAQCYGNDIVSENFATPNRKDARSQFVKVIATRTVFCVNEQCLN